MSSYCGECEGMFKRGEKVVATCRGRKLVGRAALEIEFYHLNCWMKLHGETYEEGEQPETQTVTEWRKKFAEEYFQLR